MPNYKNELVILRQPLRSSAQITQQPDDHQHYFFFKFGFNLL